MDEETAYRLFEAGQQVDLVIDGKREDGVFIKGVQLPSGVLDLMLRTPVDKPDRRAWVPRQRVELAP